MVALGRTWVGDLYAALEDVGMTWVREVYAAPEDVGMKGWENNYGI